MIEKNKESQGQSLAELQQELKSLKALLLSRGTPLPTSPSTPIPSIAARPSIPAWQLAGIKPTSSSSAPATPAPAPVPESSVSPSPSADKGKAPAVRVNTQLGPTSDSEVASTTS
jgi:peroxin-14